MSNPDNDFPESLHDLRTLLEHVSSSNTAKIYVAMSRRINRTKNSIDFLRCLMEFLNTSYKEAERLVGSSTTDAARLHEGLIMLHLMIGTPARAKVLASMDTSTDLHWDANGHLATVSLPLPGNSVKGLSNRSLSRDLSYRLERHLAVFWPYISRGESSLLFPGRNNRASTDRRVIAGILLVTRRRIPWTRGRVRRAIAESLLS